VSLMQRKSCPQQMDPVSVRRRKLSASDESMRPSLPVHYSFRCPDSSSLLSCSDSNLKELLDRDIERVANRLKVETRSRAQTVPNSSSSTHSPREAAALRVPPEDLPGMKYLQLKKHLLALGISPIKLNKANGKLALILLYEEHTANTVPGKEGLTEIVPAVKGRIVAIDTLDTKRPMPPGGCRRPPRASVASGAPPVVAVAHGKGFSRLSLEQDVLEVAEAYQLCTKQFVHEVGIVIRVEDLLEAEALGHQRAEQLRDMEGALWVDMNTAEEDEDEILMTQIFTKFESVAEERNALHTHMEKLEDMMRTLELRSARCRNRDAHGKPCSRYCDCKRLEVPRMMDSSPSKRMLQFATCTQYIEVPEDDSTWRIAVPALNSEWSLQSTGQEKADVHTAQARWESAYCT